MSTATINLSPELYAYIHKVSLREPTVLKELRDETRHVSGAIMQISPEQGQFMALLVGILGAKKTLDIGTFTGYSALAVALALPHEGRVISCDVNEESTTMAQRYWEKAHASHKIKLQLAPALDTLNQLIDNGEAGTFDFAFIDADKRNYTNYYEKSLALLRKGGLIAVDNVLWGGKVANEELNDHDTKAIRDLNSKIAKDDRVTISMIPIGDGLMLARKI